MGIFQKLAAIVTFRADSALDSMCTAGVLGKWRLRKLEKAAAELMANIHTTNGEVGAMRYDYDNAKAEFTQAHEKTQRAIKNSEPDEEVNKLAAKSFSLKQQVDTFEVSIKSVQTTVDALRRHHTNLTTRIHAMSTRLATLDARHKLARIEQRTASVLSELTDKNISGSVHDLERQVVRDESKAASFTDQLQRIEKEMADSSVDNSAALTEYINSMKK